MLSVSPILSDIIISILEELRHGTQTLRACSLLSRFYLWPSRKVLFSVICLNGYAGKAPTRCQRLHRLLESNPQIASCVRELHLREDGDSGWIAGEKTLPLVLRALGCLRALFILAFMEDLDWRNLSIDLQLAFLERFKSLTTLRIWHLHNLPIDQFHRLPQIKSMSLASSHAMDKAEIPSHTPSSKITYLESLEIVDTLTPDRQLFATYLTTPHSPLSISRLRVLSVIGGDFNTLQVAAELMKLAQSVECFLWLSQHEGNCPNSLNSTNVAIQS
jgi:hypothetical protein